MEAGATFEGGSSWNAIRISPHDPLPLFGVAASFTLNPPMPSGHCHRHTISRRLPLSLFLSAGYSRTVHAVDARRLPASSCPSRVVTWREIEFPDDHPITPRSVWLPENSAESKVANKQRKYPAGEAENRAVFISFNKSTTWPSVSTGQFYRLINPPCNSGFSIDRHSRWPDILPCI